MATSKRPPTPTRICPHRWCMPLHLAMGGLGILAMIVLLARGGSGASLGNISLFWIVSAIGAVAAYAVSRVVLGQSSTQLARLDRLDRINGIVLVVRPMWAAIALTTDIITTAIVGSAGALALAGQAGPSAMSDVTQSAMLGALLVTLGFQGFRDFAHRMATKPVKPKRVTVPALASAGA